MVIKLCAFELDYVFWEHKLDQKFGQGSPDKLRTRFGMDHIVEDSSNPNNHIVLRPDITRIMYDICKNDIQVAVVSNNGQKRMCDRALHLFTAPDKQQSMQPINPTFLKYDENCSEPKSEMFKKIQGWSGFDYSEMAFFDIDSSEARKVNKALGVQVTIVDKEAGVTWQKYQDALQDVSKGSRCKELAPYTDMPSLGDRLGGGKFAEAFRARRDPESVVKKLKNWKSGFQARFAEIYRAIESGHPFEPDSKPNKEDEQFLYMIAMEFRNLKAVGELLAPQPDRFCGWFLSRYIHGTPIWHTAGYQHFPFMVPFQAHAKRAFHLIVDRLEWSVKEFGIEHRDPHLGNAKFVVTGECLEEARLLDWGFAVRMKWDGRHYIRDHDKLVWNSGEPGAKYTPEEFRRYWIDWMVMTEYEAQMNRNNIDKTDCREYLKDISWYYQRS